MYQTWQGLKRYLFLQFALVALGNVLIVVGTLLMWAGI